MEVSKNDSFTSSNAQTSTEVDSDFIIHEVGPTDTIAGLAIKYNVTMNEIKYRNRVFNDGFIYAKRYLKIPTESTLDGVIRHSTRSIPQEFVLDHFHNDSLKRNQELLYSTSSTLSVIEDDEHNPCDIELTSLKRS